MRRAVPYVAFGATSLLVVTMVVGTLWALGSATGDREKFSSLQIAPNESAFYVAINTDPTSSQWVAVADALDTVNAKGPIREAIDEALLEFGLEFDRDILPLAGDEGYLAITDMEELSAETGGLVVAFRLRDAGKAEQIALDVAEHEGTVFTEEEYEGVTIRETDGLSEDEAGAIAFVQDVMILGISRQDVRGVIDVIHGRAENAEGDSRLRELADRQEDDFLMWGYADLAPVWEMVEGNLPDQIGQDGGSEFFEPVESDSGEVEVEAPPEAETGFAIPAVDVDYRIEGGALHVTERITVDFGETPRAGFNRDIATRVNYDIFDDVIVTIDALSVKKDGVPEAFVSVPDGDYYRVIIGDPAVPLTGEHQYELQYSANGGIIDVEEDERTSLGKSYDVVWEVTGRQWGVPIEHASASATISGESFLSFSCSTGPIPLPALQLGCSTSQDGIKTMHFEADGPIEPGSGMSFFVSVPGQSGAAPAVLVPRKDFSFDDESFGSFEEEQDEFPLTFNTEELMEEVRGAYDRASFSIASTGDGFALDVNILRAADYEPKYAFEPTQAFDTQFADAVPADTMFYYAGYNLYEQSWLPLRDYLKDAEWNNGTTFDDYLMQFRDETGLDLEEDILALLTGEYAIAGNASNFEGETPEFSIMAMLDVSDAERAEQSLDKLGEYLETQQAVEVDEESGVQRWTVLGSNAEVVGLTVSEDSLVAGYPDSAVDDFVAGPDESLAGTDDWERTMRLLPEATTSVGFLSISRVLDELRQVEEANSSFEQATEGEVTLEDLEPIRSIGMATAEIEGGWQFRAVLLIDEE